MHFFTSLLGSSSARPMRNPFMPTHSAGSAARAAPGPGRVGSRRGGLPAWLRHGVRCALLLAAAGGASADSLTLNLKDADLATLIATVAEATGKNFVVDPRVKGSVTVISAQPLSNGALYQAFLSVLQVHGYAAVPSGNVIKIVPEAGARTEGAGQQAGQLPAGAEALETRVVPIRHVRADQLVSVLRPLVPQYGHLAANPGSNVLIISDRAANVARLLGLIERIDVPGEAEVEVITLTHASAVEVARILDALQPGGAEGGVPGARARLTADPRTNSLLMSGDAATRLRMRAVATHLDMPMENDGNTHVLYLHYANAKDLAPILEGVSETLRAAQVKDKPASGEAAKSSIQVDEQTNALIVTASPAVVRSLSAVVRQLDVRRAQVLVEAVIAEVASDKAQELGIQWRATTEPGSSGVFGGTNFGGTGSSISQLSTDPLAVGSGLSLGFIDGTVAFAGREFLNIAALIRALTADTSTNILSTPSLVTLDNESAEIVIAQNVPFLTGQYVATGAGNGQVNPFQTIRREDVGLILRVRPQINEGSALKLEIEQEVSNLVPSTSTSSASAQGAVDLITDRRFLKTTVMVEDGQMLVLGGLLFDDVQQNEEKVPGFGDLPLLGALFRYERTSKIKRNLMVFLRPVILRDRRGELVSSAKYGYIRARQLEREAQGAKRTLVEEVPVLPELKDYLADPAAAPSPPPAPAPEPRPEARAPLPVRDLDP
jgi:general secretion pathway protein D